MPKTRVGGAQNLTKEAGKKKAEKKLKNIANFWQLFARQQGGSGVASEGLQNICLKMACLK